ncbi:hypothetical protein NECAME_03538 [Necator americanus]|uniref:Major facilitator superfamily (MFS) profile domain-containing protein n=1 Tax=Necator americanus TaxID=51031 RepID=W2T2D4_NECAM|nr:hypothetical protein NECAME_03538 [Necator americanus]ETN76165.1 hypothetical protein NECAME_03538 [Necator americanus]
MSFYKVNRFHLFVLFTWQIAGFFAAQQIFGIFSNYSPKWKCGSLFFSVIGIARIILTITCMLFPEWRAASIACALILIPAILCIFFVFPESPTWLHNKVKKKLHRSQEFDRIRRQGRIEEMYDAERYIAHFAGVKYEPVEHKSIEHVKTLFEMLQTPGLFRRLAVLWMMWFVAAFCAYGNDLNSNTIYGNLFVNQILFAVLITISKWAIIYHLTTPKIPKENTNRFQGVGILVINLIGSVFIEYTWDACFLCAVESLETSCRGSGTGSCSLMARIGAISAPFLTYMNNFWPPSVYFSVFVLGTTNLMISYNFLIETKGVDLDNVETKLVEQNRDALLMEPSTSEIDVSPGSEILVDERSD